MVFRVQGGGGGRGGEFHNKWQKEGAIWCPGNAPVYAHWSEPLWPVGLLVALKTVISSSSFKAGLETVHGKIEALLAGFSQCAETGQAPTLGHSSALPLPGDGAHFPCSSFT